MSDDYLKYIDDVKTRKTKSKAKKRKVAASPLPIRESSTPTSEVGTPVVILSPSSSPPPTAPTPPATRPEPTGNVVFLELGELWKKGATKSLVAAIRPPKEYESSSTIILELVTSIRRHHEEGLKAVSLLNSFAELAISHESSQAALRLKASDAEKAAREAEKAVKDAEKVAKDAEKLAREKGQKLDKANEVLSQLKTSVTNLKAKISDLENKVGVSDMAVELALKEKSDLEAEVKTKDDQIKVLKEDYAKVKQMLRQAMIKSFENAIAQAEILNPGMVTEGMAFNNVIKEGQIVPYSLTVASQAPSASSQEESDDGEEEGEDEEVEAGDAAPQE